MDQQLTRRLFWCLLVLHTIPLFFGRYFPTQDGPSHLYNAEILKSLLVDPHSAFHQYYTINAQPNPNWLVSIVFALLLSFLPAFLAEKIVLLAYVLLLPLSFRFMLRQINPKSGFLALLIFPFVYNITFYLGFFNFCLSIILFCFTVGYWFKYKNRFGIKKQAVLCILVWLTYFCHPVSFVIEGLVMGFLLMAFLWDDLRADRNHARRNFAYRTLNLAIAFLPMLLFLLLFVNGSKDETDFANRSLQTFLPQLFQDYIIAYGGTADLWFCRILAAIIGLLMLYTLYQRLKTRKIYPLDILFVFLALFVAMAYFSPESLAGGSVILVRLILYANLLALVWLAASTYPVRLAQVASWLFFGFALAYLGYKAWGFMDDQHQLADVLSVEAHIKANSNPDHTKTILPFVPKLTGNDSIPADTVRDIDINVFQHVSDYISIDRDLVSLQNYEASSGYFPVQWKAGYDPAAWFTESGTGYTDSTLNAYQQKTGIHPDYIIISSPGVSYCSTWQHLQDEVENRYKAVAASLKMDTRLFGRR